MLIEKQGRREGQSLIGYVDKLLAAFGKSTEFSSSHQTSRRCKNLQQLLIEPLSPRELEVLQLISQGLSNQEIADRLFLALSTVKGYTRTLFDKLQVQRRTEAVARAPANWACCNPPNHTRHPTLVATRSYLLSGILPVH